jgi:hypothetical protein
MNESKVQEYYQILSPFSPLFGDLGEIGESLPATPKQITSLSFNNLSRFFINHKLPSQLD